MSLYFDKGANRSLSNLDAAGEEKFTDKQDTLVSGENIKTINGVSVLGEGNIEVGEGGTITVNQTYDPTSSYAQSGTAVADALANSMEAVSQNGTISNCILEIPQNIKLTLENNVLTLKAGSILVRGGDTYVTTTTTQDESYTIPSTQAQGRYFSFAEKNTGALQGLRTIVKITSGTTAQRPEWSLSIAHSIYFDVDTKTFYYATGTQWIEWVVAYPLCVIDVDSSGVASFAKDSHGNDMIFNGIGFIGHHAFIYPDVRKLICKGKTNGKLNSYNELVNGLYIVDLGQGVGTRALISRNGNSYYTNPYWEVDKYSDLVAQTGIQYCREKNYCYSYNNGIFNELSRLALIYITYNGTTVTQFDIRQPYEGARDLLTDELEDRVETLETTTPTLSGNNTFTGSNTFGNNTYTSSIVTETYKNKVAEKGVNAPTDNVYLCHYRYTDKNDNVLAHQFFYIPIGTTDVKYILRLTDNTSAGATAYEDVISAKYGANGAEIEIKANKGTFPSLFTSMTGYDASKTQTLKNVNGTLTWVDD